MIPISTDGNVVMLVDECTRVADLVPQGRRPASRAGQGGDMNAMAAAQQAWDNAQPPDTSRQEREHEQACKAALALYLESGDLPGREDASHVWDELEDDEASGIVLFDMLAAYRADNDAELLALAKRVAERVDSIVNEKIEEGL